MACRWDNTCSLNWLRPDLVGLGDGCALVDGEARVGFEIGAEDFDPQVTAVGVGVDHQSVSRKDELAGDDPTAFVFRFQSSPTVLAQDQCTDRAIVRRPLAQCLAQRFPLGFGFLEMLSGQNLFK